MGVKYMLPKKILSMILSTEGCELKINDTFSSASVPVHSTINISILCQFRAFRDVWLNERRGGDIY